MQSHANTMQRSMRSTVLHTGKSPLKGAGTRPRQNLVCRAASSTTAKKPEQKGTERTMLGNSGLEVDKLCIGAWSWNDRSRYWGQEEYGNHGDYSEKDIREAYKALLDNGLTFIDTAEVYGFGKSEELIGDLRKQTGTDPTIATKFAPLPWRFSADNVVKGIKGSLSRLQQDKLGLYQIHWPGFPLVNNFVTNSFVEGLGRAKLAGLTDAVGVSNFKADRVREANKILQDKGVPLASNQVQYSLLYRAPERNGVIEACKETNTALLAYSPITQGLLSGKYTETSKPGGPREALFNDDRIRQIQPLLSLLRDIGSAHDGKTCAQVAVNWVISKGEQNGFNAIPILGVKSRKQADEAKGILGWRLTEDEVKALDRTSQVLGDGSLGAPFEQW